MKCQKGASPVSEKKLTFATSRSLEWKFKSKGEKLKFSRLKFPAYSLALRIRRFEKCF